MDRPLSRRAFEEGEKSILAGVNSPARSFDAVDAPPVVAAYGQGPFLYDVDHNRYIDYLMSWGAIILGHAYPSVRQAIDDASGRGTGFGLSTEPEYALAELIIDAFPSIDSLRLVNSGTEAVMSAVRLARGYTGRPKILMFEGCYHGHNDGLLARAGSGLASFGIPGSAGVPAAFVEETLIARYNDLDSVERLCRKHGDKIACILVEAVGGNMGVVPPAPGFLEGLREIADRRGALLIFDEVVTGFRVAWGGAQERYRIKADLTTLGKIIGGGLPVGAFGGRRAIMEKLAPLGDVYQAGTLAGNPVVASAGRAVLNNLKERDHYAALEERAASLAEEIRQAASVAGFPLQVNRVGSMFTCFFSADRVTDYRSARASDTERYASFFRRMLAAGVLLPPSQFETGFVSLSHSEDDIVATAKVVREVVEELGV
jgi:glutamate-1-semialdehyde 2,1-aminomutase